MSAKKKTNKNNSSSSSAEDNNAVDDDEPDAALTADLIGVLKDAVRNLIYIYD